MWRFNLFVFVFSIGIFSSCDLKESQKSTGIDKTQFQESPLNLLVFFIEDCPVCFSAASVIGNVSKEFPELNIQWIYSTQIPDFEKLDSFKLVYGISSEIVMDQELSIAKAFGAKVTPEVFLVNERGEVLYRGLVDNYYFKFGKHRPKSTQDYLHDVLKALKEKRPIPITKTEAIGCIIEYED